MKDTCRYRMLTFATKYSRIPNEEYAWKRYNALMEIGKKPIELNPKGYQILSESFEQQAELLKIKLIVCNILPDHVHIVLDANGKSMPEIAKKLKGASARAYNKFFDRTGSLRTRGYNDTYLYAQDHVVKAIKYVENNHIKHKTATFMVIKYN